MSDKSTEGTRQQAELWYEGDQHRAEPAAPPPWPLGCVHSIGISGVEIRPISLFNADFFNIVIINSLMFAADPVNAIRGVHRVLPPDGRLAVAVWGS